MTKPLIILTILLNFGYNQCPGDVNEDYNVDISDVIQILSHILAEQTLIENLLYIADVNSDQNIDIIDIIIIVNTILYEYNPCNENFSGITETDLDGNLIGEVDDNDWCEFEFNSSDTGFGLNPVYPNPLISQEWGPFGQSYQLCYQFSTPYDPTWSNLNNLNIDIINNEGQSIYSYNDNYANGQTAICAYIPVEDVEIIENSIIYRMVMTSGDFECHGDIQFNQ